MTPDKSSSPLDFYFNYLEEICPTIVREEFEGVITRSIQDVCWEDPQIALDLNNFAVIALIEAENTEDDSERKMLLNLAIEALSVGMDKYQHPLCVAHLALTLYLTGESHEAEELAYTAFVEVLQAAYYAPEDPGEPIGLIYLPPLFDRALREATISELFRATSAHRQALLFLAKTLVLTQPVFYNSHGLRWLELAASLFPDAPRTNLALGISKLQNRQAEGLLYLHQAQQSDPAAPDILQALSLAYRDRGDLKNADLWKTIACACQLPATDPLPQWRWTEVDLDSSLTYLAYDGLTLAVEPSFQSIVTSVLLAQGDWFEREIEFWRTWLKPGMTVLDVGANVGVYTFSAAQRVGPQGCVIAIEPFSPCVHCLNETKQLNGLDWVKIYEGAASSRSGTAALKLYPASELNEIIPNASASTAHTQTVHCITLDELMFREELSRVDFIKLDAEGHELDILAGASQMIAVFQPTILYENIAGSKGSNLAVANTLRAIGYQLYHYQPYLKELVPLASNEALHGLLNVIAIHPSQYDTVIALGYADTEIADDAALAELLMVADVGDL
ncbi:MAG: FkbM family methyltransferase [Oscillatoriales cyanobacterium]|nr:MAG: FkbM family methyltransferase [Oscillatoriales cyanobacterium]